MAPIDSARRAESIGATPGFRLELRKFPASGRARLGPCVEVVRLQFLSTIFIFIFKIFLKFEPEGGSGANRLNSTN